MMARGAARFATAAAVAAVLWFYAWTVGVVNGVAPLSPDRAANDYYNHLVAGFVQGHLYMDLPVAEGLTKLADPYDPAQNEPYRATDASYYHGHYYLYFGAAPAATLLLPIRVITGKYLPTPCAILFFCWVGFTAAAVLWLSLRRRYFPTVPGWTGAIGVLVLAMGSTAPVLLRRPFFWELATAGGFGFAMLAALALWAAIHSERRPATWMLIAGILLGLAVASRPTYIYTIPILAVPLLVTVGAPGARVNRWRMAIAAAIGVGVMGVAVFAYNYARFGNGLEFGHNYLLSVAYESKVKLFSFRHVLFNARMYFTLPGQWSWHAPFFSPIPVKRADMPPGFYTVDDPFGLLPVFPIALLALASPLALWRRDVVERNRLGALLAVLTIMTLAAGGVILLYVATIPRYAVDFFPALALLSAVGLLAVLRWADARRARRVAEATLFLLAIGSLALGTVALCDAGRLLAHRRPESIQRIERTTTRLEALRDRLHGIHYGPEEYSIRFGVATGEIQTLLTAGDTDEPDRVLLQRASSAQARFGLQHATAPILWSTPVHVHAGETHRLRVELGSFYPPLEHGIFADMSIEKAAWIQHRAELRFDGRPILRTYAPFRPARAGAPRRLAIGNSWSLVSSDPRPAQLAEREIDAPENLRLEFVVPPEAGRWPLLASGNGTERDALYLDATPNAGRLAYRHGGDAVQWSASFPLPAGPHRVELRQTEYGWTQPRAGDRLLVAWVDGLLVWKQRVSAFAADAESIVVGRNAGRIPECAAAFPGGLKAGSAPANTRSVGGSLLLRVMMPAGTKTAWQPLVSMGRTGAADTLSIFYIGLDVGQFRFDHWAAPLIVGDSVAIDKTVGHDLEVHFPSFNSANFGQASTDDVWVTLDGRQVIRGRSASFEFAPNDPTLGFNRAHATMDDAYFRGGFIQRVWTGTASPVVP